MPEEYNSINPKTYARIKNVSGHHFALFVAENRIVDANNYTMRKSYADAHIKTLNKADLKHFIGGWIRYVHYRKESYNNRPEESKWLNELQYIKETYTSNKEVFISDKAEQLFLDFLPKVEKTDFGMSLLYQVFLKHFKIIATKEVYVEYLILNNIVSSVGSIRSEDEVTRSAKNYALFVFFEKEMSKL